MAAAPTLLKLLKKAKQAELSPKIWLLISEQGQQDLLLLQHSVQHLSCSAGIDLGARTMSGLISGLISFHRWACSVWALMSCPRPHGSSDGHSSRDGTTFPSPPCSALRRAGGSKEKPHVLLHTPSRIFFEEKILFFFFKLENLPSQEFNGLSEKASFGSDSPGSERAESLEGWGRQCLEPAPSPDSRRMGCSTWHPLGLGAPNAVGLLQGHEFLMLGLLPPCPRSC